MAVLITGGSGFVGLNIVQAVLARGDDVVLFDRGRLPPGAERALDPWSDFLWIEQGDVLDAQRLDEVFKRYAIKTVVHGSAVTSGTEREGREPSNILDVNLRGTLNVLEAARTASVRRFLYIGSGAAYGEMLYRLPRLYEHSPSVPTSLYSITKHAAERTCLRLKALWALDLVCVRLGTVIGPWERNTGVRDNFGTHSQLAAMAVSGKHAVLPQRAIQRDWVYALDVANAIVKLLDWEEPLQDVYNLSSGVKWREPIVAWCETLKQKYPRFDYRVAAGTEQPNVWYIDTDRGLMDVGRLERDIDYRAHDMQAAYAHYLDWIERTPDFFTGKT